MALRGTAKTVGAQPSQPSPPHLKLHATTTRPPTTRQARTIDLCNNPLTKEPKLTGARRIIREWPDLNREAQEFTALVRSYCGRGWCC